MITGDLADVHVKRIIFLLQQMGRRGKHRELQRLYLAHNNLGVAGSLALRRIVSRVRDMQAVPVVSNKKESGPCEIWTGRPKDSFFF